MCQRFREFHIPHAQFALGKADAVERGRHPRRRHAPVDGVQRHGQREKGVGAGFDFFLDGIPVQVDETRQDQIIAKVDPRGRLGRVCVQCGDVAIRKRQATMPHTLGRNDAGVFQMLCHATASNALRSTSIVRSASRSTTPMS
jgi:hypothetical protein